MKLDQDSVIYLKSKSDLIKLTKMMFPIVEEYIKTQFGQVFETTQERHTMILKALRSVGKRHNLWEGKGVKFTLRIKQDVCYFVARKPELALELIIILGKFTIDNKLVPTEMEVYLFSGNKSLTV